MYSTLIRSYRMIVVLVLTLMAFILGACAPKVLSFTPSQGPPGTNVTIVGKNFKSTAAGNTVKFKNVTSTNVTVPQTDRIIAEVPTGAATGRISVKTDKGTGYSENNFIVTGGTTANWTFMVYIDGDNNLEDAAIDDFLEMASVGSSAQINIVVQMDRIAGYDSTNGNWTGARRFLIQNGDTPSVAAVQDMGEKNMGDPGVLQDFVEWGITNYPAQHYALVIWNHGGGWRLRQEMAADRYAREGNGGIAIARAIAWDDTDGDVLYMREVQTALEGALATTSTKLDIVGFDACLMGMLENAYAVRRVASYVVGSEENEPWDGWPYDAILTALDASPTLSPADLSGIIVTEYFNSYSGSSGITQAALDLSKLSTVINNLNAFISKANTEWGNLSTARANTVVYHSFGPSYWGADLRGFAHNVVLNVTSTDIKTAAGNLRNSIDDLIVNELHSADMNGSHGVALYFPVSLTTFNNDPDHTGYEDSNTFMPVDFVKYHNWDNWLKDYYANTP